MRSKRCSALPTNRVNTWARVGTYGALADAFSAAATVLSKARLHLSIACDYLLDPLDGFDLPPSRASSKQSHRPADCLCVAL